MDTNHSMQDTIIPENEVTEVSRMELKRAQELIAQLKKIKTSNEITYPRLMERIEENGKSVSLSTLRRVFADGSELNANSFSYENTLLPIAEVLLRDEDVPTPEDNPCAEKINGLKAVIRTQNEEIAHLYELKEQLDSSLKFYQEQIVKKDRRMDEKDEIIKQLMEENRELSKRLMNKML